MVCHWFIVSGWLLEPCCSDYPFPWGFIPWGSTFTSCVVLCVYPSSLKRPNPGFRPGARVLQLLLMVTLSRLRAGSGGSRSTTCTSSTPQFEDGEREELGKDKVTNVERLHHVVNQLQSEGGGHKNRWLQDKYVISRLQRKRSDVQTKL